MAAKLVAPGRVVGSVYRAFTIRGGATFTVADPRPPTADLQVRAAVSNRRRLVYKPNVTA